MTEHVTNITVMFGNVGNYQHYGNVWVGNFIGNVCNLICVTFPSQSGCLALMKLLNSNDS